MSSKRERSSSPPPSLSPSSPTYKLLKIVRDAPNAPLTCSLPPTCAHKPTLLTSTHDLETHYATYHSHVCEYQGCNNLFPDTRLLELHFAECHDPITALKKERGEKTFACHLPSCNRLFMTPKARRLHLIHAHGYPKEYFFAVTNKGIGGLLNKWGQGVSLIRGEWRPRVQDHEMDSSGDGDLEDPHLTADEHASYIGGDSTVDSLADDHVSGPSMQPTFQSDALTNAVSSLSLVPNKIRFGRGGKKGGFVHPPAQHGKGASLSSSVEQPKLPDAGLRPPRRRGGQKETRRKPSEGTSSTSGDLDGVAMQE